MSLKLLEIRPNIISEAALQKLEELGPFIKEESILKPRHIPIQSEGDYYGDHIKGKPNGVGSLIKKDGSLLEGNFNKGLPIGECRLIDRTGNVFTGHWMGMDAIKNVKIDYINGSQYQGDIENYKPHGRGNYKTTDGTIKGNFIRGRIDKGEMVYHDGRKYSGSLRDYLPYGQGKLRYPNKDLYDGEFVNGLRQGNGKLVKSSGEVFEGPWENDEFAGDEMEKSRKKQKKKKRQEDSDSESEQITYRKSRKSKHSARALQQKEIEKNYDSDSSSGGVRHSKKNNAHKNTIHKDKKSHQKYRASSDSQEEDDKIEEYIPKRKERKIENKKQIEADLSNHSIKEEKKQKGIDLLKHSKKEDKKRQKEIDTSNHSIKEEKKKQKEIDLLKYSKREDKKRQKEIDTSNHSIKEEKKKQKEIDLLKYSKKEEKIRQKEIDTSNHSKKEEKKSKKVDNSSEAIDPKPQDNPKAQGFLSVFKNPPKKDSLNSPTNKPNMAAGKNENKNPQRAMNVNSGSSDEDRKPKKDSKLDYNRKNSPNKEEVKYRVPDKRSTRDKKTNNILAIFGGKPNLNASNSEESKKDSSINFTESSARNRSKRANHKKNSGIDFSAKITEKSFNHSNLEFTGNLSKIDKNQSVSGGSLIDEELLQYPIRAEEIPMPGSLSIYTLKDKNKIKEKLEALRQSRIMLDENKDITVDYVDVFPNNSLVYTRQNHPRRKQIQEKRESKGINMSFSLDTDVFSKRSVKSLQKIIDGLPDFPLTKQYSNYWCDLQQVDEDIWYKGELDHYGKRSGSGIEVTEQSIYEGSWIANLKNGLGREVSHEEIYVGHWQNNHKSGFGMLKFKNGSFYSGDWKNDLPNGKGYEHCITQVYDGDFIEGERHGNGTLTLKSGSKYTGGFKGGLPHGFGRIEWANSDCFFGIFSHGELASNLHLNKPSDEQEFKFLSSYRSSRPSSHSDEHSHLALPGFNIGYSCQSIAKLDESSVNQSRILPFTYRPK